MPTNPTAAILVIGDEILSGRTRDANMHHSAAELAKSGIDLLEARIVPDVAQRIISAVNELRSAYDYVFTSGGIGPTHDDITADAVAEAFGVEIGIREDALEIMGKHYEARGQEMTAPRLRMARIPDGAELIRNIISSAPGFSIENVHVMAGVPAIFRCMLAEVLSRLPGGKPLSSSSVDVSRMEGDIAEDLVEIVGRYSDLSIGSYPFRRNGGFGVSIVIRGRDDASVQSAEAEVRRRFAGELGDSQ